MSLSINTNISAMIALQNLNSTTVQEQTSIERLSTGLRINSGADDPAGMIISQGMQSEIQGITQAIQNTQNASNMAKTADVALGEIQSLLLDLRGLAVNAANSAVEDTASLQADQTQVQSILQSIDRIASSTEFNNKKLLDGTAGALANVTDSTDVSGLYVGGTFNGSSILSGAITVSKVAAATEATVTLANTFASANAIITTAGSIVVNGYSISTSGTDSVQTLVSKINAQAGTTGVTAAISGTGPVQIVLQAKDFGSQFGISYFDPSKMLDNKTSESAAGTNAVLSVTAMTSAGLQTAMFTGGQGGGASGLKLTDLYGNSILLTEGGNANITGLGVQVGQVTAGSVQFQVGPDSSQAVSFALPDAFSSNLGTGVIPGQSLANIDLTTTQGANNAMNIVQAAVSQLATTRGQLGSFQKNVLQAGQAYLQIAQQNLTASYSNITDVDMASEMTNFTKLQILQQSGVAVLSQANSTPKSIITLLQNA